MLIAPPEAFVEFGGKTALRPLPTIKTRVPLPKLPITPTATTMVEVVGAVILIQDRRAGGEEALWAGRGAGMSMGVTRES